MSSPTADVSAPMGALADGIFLSFSECWNNVIFHDRLLTETLAGDPKVLHPVSRAVCKKPMVHTESSGIRNTVLKATAAEATSCNTRALWYLQGNSKFSTGALQQDQVFLLTAKDRTETGDLGPQQVTTQRANAKTLLPSLLETRTTSDSKEYPTPKAVLTLHSKTEHRVCDEERRPEQVLVCKGFRGSPFRSYGYGLRSKVRPELGMEKMYIFTLNHFEFQLYHVHFVLRSGTLSVILAFGVKHSSVDRSEETTIHEYGTHLSLGQVPVLWMETCPTTHIRAGFPSPVLQEAAA